MAQNQTQNPITRTSVHFTLGEGIVVSADVQSKTRRGLTHYTRIVLDPLNLEVVKATCDCEGFTFRGKCWHIETLKQLIMSELKEEVEKVKDQMLKFEEETMRDWG